MGGEGKGIADELADEQLGGLLVWWHGGMGGEGELADEQLGGLLVGDCG